MSERHALDTSVVKNTAIELPPPQSSHRRDLNDEANHMPPPAAPDVSEDQPPPALSPPPPTITFAPNVEPFVPAPLIADLLRTRFCIPDSIFLVEAIESSPLPRSNRWRVVRAMLGDGELCIQALLVPGLHRFVNNGSVAVGSYVRLPDFATRRHRIANSGGTGRQKMVYLVVSDIVTVGWHNALREMARTKTKGERGNTFPREQPLHAEGNHRYEEEDELGEAFIAESDIELDDVEHTLAQAQADTRPPRRRVRFLLPRSHGKDDDEEDDDDGAFETMIVTPTKSTQRRERLANMPASMSPNVGTDTRDWSQTKLYQHQYPSASAPGAATGRADSVGDVGPLDDAPQTQAESQHAPVALAKHWTDLSIPLKLTRLCSINSLPYKQNWSINVLVIVVSLGEVEPSHIPPNSQRIARLADPSTDKHIMLAVLLDPQEFAPKVGSVVLLVGVKNHLFDGGSLKKYVSDRPTTQGGRWWFQDPSQFEWCDADGMQKWWDESQRVSQEEDV